MSMPADLHTGKCNLLKRYTLTKPGIYLFLVFHKILHSSVGNRANVAGKPIKQLDYGNNLKHVGCSKQTQCQVS
jgi:hypothetical protein